MEMKTLLGLSQVPAMDTTSLGREEDDGRDVVVEMRDSHGLTLAWIDDADQGGA